MNSERFGLSPLPWQFLLALLLICAPDTILSAQGYLYTFSGSDASELNGSFIVLSNNGGGSPSLSSLSAARILDSFGSAGAFDILAPPNSVSGFAVASFGSTGFSGEITCEMFGYLGSPSVVVLSGEPARISFSSNLFFPGNPAGGAISGTWAVEAIPEPQAVSVILLAAAVSCGYRSLIRRRAGAINL